jgi:2-iminobutanoate/2-iminopropanoate deaminase
MSSASVQKEIISSPDAPAALAAYSQATRAGTTLYCSGCLGMEPKTGELREGIEAQTEQALKNLQAIIEAGGSSMDNVLKCTIFLAGSMEHYAKVNEIYVKYFPKNPPARSCIAVAALPRNGLMEIEAIALVTNSKL